MKKLLRNACFITLGICTVSSAIAADLTPIQKAGAICVEQARLLSKNTPGKTTLSSKEFQTSDTVSAGPNSQTVSHTVGVPYAEVPSDGSTPGKAWKACMISKGFPVPAE